MARFQLPPTLPGTLADQFPGLSISEPGSAAVPTQADMDSLIKDLAGTVRDIAGGLSSGDIDTQEFSRQMAAALEPAHADAFHLGRRKGGDLAAFDALDALMGQRIMDGEQAYLDQFAADIDGGRYTQEDGTYSSAGIENRALLYVGKVDSSADEGFLASSEDDELIYWNLGGTEHHCSQCPDLAAGSPYPASELDVRPGNGTECGTRCRCFLTREDGAESFQSVEF